MKTALAYALIFGMAATGESLASPRQCAVAATAYATTEIQMSASRNPAPVAELRTGCGPSKEGLLLRVVTAPHPAQMVNPAAPALYGSGRCLATYSDTYSHIDANPNVRRLHSDGLRLWAYHDFW